MVNNRLLNFIGILAVACLPAQLCAQVQVRVQPVVLAPITEHLPLSGSVLSPRYSDLAAQESGLVVSLNVDTGDRVKQGDVLLQLDGELNRLELQRLLARQEEAQLAYDDARRLADEGRQLINDRNISRSQYETRLANEATQETKLRQLDSQVRMQQVKYQRHKLIAPFSGVIGFRHTELGEWLGAGDSAMQLVQLDPLRVQANVPERYFGEITVGTPVTILVDAHPGKPLHANVENVVMVADSATRSFTARMDIPNTNEKLAPGMSAHLVFELGGAISTPVLQVPADAVVRRSDGGAVIWVVRENVAEPVSVSVGRRNEQQVEVVAGGLAEGDLAVTLGNESLRPGQQVTAIRD
jgi:RND family efflux transporter MFP subunit